MPDRCLSCRQSATKKHSRFDPVSLNCARRDAERGCSLLFAQSSKESALDHFREPRLGSRETVYSFIDLEHHLGLLLSRDLLVVERDTHQHAFALVGEARARAVNEYVPHCYRSEREKMTAITPCYAGLVDELQVGFVNETSCRQRRAAGTERELMTSNEAEVFVNERHERIE
jgi:hypothetical protein